MVFVQGNFKSAGYANAYGQLGRSDDDPETLWG